MQSSVLVLGAGPAGALAATLLARNGWDVLLADQHKFPRDKVCGDGIPTGSLQILRQCGLGDKIDQAGFNPVKYISIIGPGGKRWTAGWHSKLPDAKEDLATARRTEFDNLLFQSAMESGVQFVQGRISSIIMENGEVKGANLSGISGKTDLWADVTIGADGATSIIARTCLPDLFQQSNRWVAIRGYAQNNGFQPDRLEFHAHRELLSGYGWIFPVDGDTVNVGLGLLSNDYKNRESNLRTILHNFLQSGPIQKRIKAGTEIKNIASWTIPIYSHRKFSRSLPGALLVGDAGFLADPLTGEGIHNALQSAMIAAGVVDAALKSPPEKRDNVLKTYDKLLREEMAGVARRSSLLSRYVLGSETLMNAIIRVANTLPGLVDSIISTFSTDYFITTERGN